MGLLDLAGLLARFRRAHPGVPIRLARGAAPDLARAAADAELDIAFIDGPADPVKLTRIDPGRDYLVLAAPRGDPLAPPARWHSSTANSGGSPADRHRAGRFRPCALALHAPG